MVGSPFRPSPNEQGKKSPRKADTLGGAALRADAGRQRAFFALARLRDIHTPDVRCPISLAVNGSEHRLHPFPEGLLCLSHGLAVTPGAERFGIDTDFVPYSFSCM